MNTANNNDNISQGTTLHGAKIVNGKKTFIPLENNPATLSLLASNLKLKNISFYEVFSLDPIIQEIPRPVHALIFIAPAPVYHRVREDETHLFGPQAKNPPPFPISGASQPIAWFEQTIGHACGFMALLHAVANGPGLATIASDSLLSSLTKQAIDLDPEARARLLYNNTELERCHMSAAVAGDTNPPDPSEPNGMHFICFVKGSDGKLWDLEGGWSGPVPRTSLDDDEDVLCEKAIQDGPGRYLEVGRKMEISEFSCVAVVLDADHGKEGRA